MALDSGTFDKSFEVLRVKYLARLRQTRIGIADFHAACEKAAVTQEQKDIMRAQAHKLYGNGKTHGFAAISDTARVIEAALETGQQTDMKTLGAQTQALLAACDEALATAGTNAMDLAMAEGVVPPKFLAVKEKPILFAADDDPNILEMVQNLFANDAEVITATNGKDALKLIEEHRPDIALLDDNMPEISGLKVLETLRAKSILGYTQIVMLTANSREKDITKSINNGAAGYITKPFNAIQLKSKILPYLQKRKIIVLVADDDAIVRELLALKFRAMGLRVLMAEDGEQALELAQSHRPQLAVLDRMMPKMDGLCVLEKMREHHNTRDIPVLFLTAKHKKDNVVEALKLGAADYIVKPFNPDEVLKRSLKLLKGGTH